MNSTNKALLQAAGFHFFPEHGDDFATIKPEPFNVGKNHFFPHFRDFYLGKAVGGFYCTSHIHGDFRKYRCKTVQYNFELGNIFGKGVTEDEAVKNFLENFKGMFYNVAK